MDEDITQFEDGLRRVNYFLKLTGINLKEGNSGKRLVERLRTRLYFFIGLICFNFDMLGEIAWLINGIRTGKKIEELTHCAPCIGQCLLANIKSYYFLKHEDIIIDLIDTLRNLKSRNKESETEKELNTYLQTQVIFLRKSTIIQSCLNLIAIIEFGIVPFVIMALTYSETGQIVLNLPFFALYPFNALDIKVWPFMYVRQNYSAFIVVFMVFGPDAYYYFCCAQIQMQFRILQGDMTNIVQRHLNKNKYGVNDEFRDKFLMLIKRHKDLIRCVDLIEHVYAKSTLFNVVSSSFLICLTGFNITAIHYLPLMVPFVGFLFLASVQIYLFCYYGDNIMRSSMEISDAVFNSQWYYVERKVAKDLLFVLTRARKPCKLTAYGFSDINLQTFSRILSTAWSYFALLTTVNRNK